jgi:hypothetical protein
LVDIINAFASAMHAKAVIVLWTSCCGQGIFCANIYFRTGAESAEICWLQMRNPGTGFVMIAGKA